MVHLVLQADGHEVVGVHFHHVAVEILGREMQALGSDPAILADQLVQMANDNGGRDNVSVIVTRVRGGFPARAGWWQKLLSRFG